MIVEKLHFLESKNDEPTRSGGYPNNKRKKQGFLVPFREWIKEEKYYKKKNCCNITSCDFCWSFIRFNHIFRFI